MKGKECGCELQRGWGLGVLCFFSVARSCKLGGFGRSKVIWLVLFVQPFHLTIGTVDIECKFFIRFIPSRALSFP